MADNNLSNFSIVNAVEVCQVERSRDLIGMLSISIDRAGSAINIF